MSTTPRTDAATLTEPYQVRELGFEVAKAEDMRALECELSQVTLERDNARVMLAAEMRSNRAADEVINELEEELKQVKL